MANNTLCMEKVRQVLLFLKRGFSHRSIERETGVNRRTVRKYRDRFLESGLSYSELLLFNDQELNAYLNPEDKDKQEKDPRLLDLESRFSYLFSELRRVGVTRQLLWEEYIQEYPTGFRYSRFCELMQEQARKNDATMYFEHSPGKLMEVDFAGDMAHYVDRYSGELIACPVFVAVLPFSGYSYVEALPNAKLPQLLGALNNALSYFGGTTESIKSDNMKQWVTRSNRYEPQFNEMLVQWANHNNLNLLAASPYKPRQKPTVEGSVNIAYKRLYAPLRNETFYSLSELNSAFRKQLKVHHDKNFQRKAFSRTELFETEEKETLHPLPSTIYELKHYTRAKVQKNYHVAVGEDWHFYSVPWRYIGKQVRIIYTTETVEIYEGSKRIALHKRSYKNHAYTTDLSHCPENHKVIREIQGWNPEDYLSKAKKHGPNTYQYFQKVMENQRVIDQSYRSCLGLLRLAAIYPKRIEGACKRALKGHRFNYLVIKTILENKVDLLEELPTLSQQYITPKHDNIRGAEEYK